MVKSERVEMRFDEELLRRVDAWIEEQADPPARSDALRTLVDIGLQVAGGKVMNMSPGEKVNFMLLRDLVKHMDVPTELNVDFLADAIHGGHYWAPVWELPGLLHNYADRPRDVTFVLDVLDMWNFIEEGVSALSPEDRERVMAANYDHAPEFVGFDGNNEPELLGIARFLIEKMDRFERFKGRTLNSHSPTISRYRNMLEVFEPLRGKLIGASLNADQIIAILNAR